MSNRWLCKWFLLVVGLLLSAATTSPAAAQWSPAAVRPVRSLDRWLGVGYSGGYHWRNPGPNTDYYQPYSDLHQGYGRWDEPMQLNAAAQSALYAEPKTVWQSAAEPQAYALEKPAGSGNRPLAEFWPAINREAANKNWLRHHPPVGQRR